MRRVVNEVNAEPYGGYMMASGGGNTMSISNGNNLNTPYFAERVNIQGSQPPSK